MKKILFVLCLMLVVFTAQAQTYFTSTRTTAYVFSEKMDMFIEISSYDETTFFTFYERKFIHETESITSTYYFLTEPETEEKKMYIRVKSDANNEYFCVLDGTVGTINFMYKKDGDTYLKAYTVK
jgi:hypothetical protein